MPQARFLGRRWRLATDSLPLLFYPLLASLSIAMLINLVSLVGTTLSNHYQCDQFAKVGAAMYGMLGIYCLEVLAFYAIVQCGWRGGPLNERARMPLMSVMIHIWICIMVFKLGFTVWGIFVVYSPTVSKDCWSSNPCDLYSAEELPRVCVPGATGNVQLTPECQVLFNNIGEFNSCLESWNNYGAGWMVDNYVGQEPGLYANFTFPGRVTCRTDVNWEKDPRLAEINPFDSNENIFRWYFYYLVYLDEYLVELNNDTGLIDYLPSAYQSVMLQFVSNGVYGANPNASFAESYGNVPWDTCLAENCPFLLGQQCSQWRIFSTIPETYKISSWFAAIMYISLAVCVLTGLIFFVSFNAFPDYECEESWQGLLSAIAKRLGYLDELTTSATHDGVDALVGIGGLLHGLFGGADLDVTDLILGLYLVHLRQKWKRKEHALRHLAQHGYKGLENSIRTWRSWIFGFIMFPLFKDRYHKKKHSVKDTDPDSNSVVLNQMSSEFESAWEHLQENDNDQRGDGGVKEDSLTLKHSFVKIQSMPCAENDGRMDANSPVRLIQQERALVTPLSLKNVSFDVVEGIEQVSKDDFVSLYMGKLYRPVEHDDLEQALHFLPIARASYGLTKGPWNAVVEPNWRYKVQTKIFKYFKTCIPRFMSNSYYQRRNMEHILRMTNVDIEDVLYASYTSSPLGVIPYLILLDSSSKKVCISVRGTVGVTDLITDLLSSPTDISMYFESSTPVYSHAGIASSSLAVVEELKNRGIWDACCIQSKTGRSNFSPRSVGSPASSGGPKDGKNMEFSLSRAIQRIKNAIHVEGYQVIVTGHSLGAAVSCLVAAKMRKIHPPVRCIAYNPPGGLFDEGLKTISESFCTSIVCGQDAISRLSIGTTKRIIDDMMFALASCKRPKLSVLFDSIIGRYVNRSAASHVFRAFDEIEPDVMDVLLGYLQKSKLHGKNVDNRPMFPPGNIIFLRSYGDLSDSKEVSWDAVWLNAHDLMDEGILLSKAMFKHHILVHTNDALMKALEAEKKRMSKEQLIPC